MDGEAKPAVSAAAASSSGRSYGKIIVAVLIIAAAIISIFLLPVRQYIVAILDWSDSLGVWGPVFVAVFYVVATVLFIPGSVITLGAGALFGLAQGFLAVWVGSNLGACAAFLVGRTLARDWIANKVAGNARFAAIEEAIAREGFKIVLLLRLSPVFPFNLLNYALGLTKVSLGQYALASIIGMIPGTLMYVYLGAAAGSLAAVAAGDVEAGTAQQVLKWIGLVVTVIVTVYVTQIARKSLRAAETRIRAENRPEKVKQFSAQSAPEIGGEITVPPHDEHNKLLVEHTHPPEWTEPEPAATYNLVVVGAGTAGLVTAAGAAGLGARVALVERHLLGGDCLNVGCVPSKSLIQSSRTAAEVINAGQYGVRVPEGVEVDFPAVMERMRRLRAEISHHDSAQRFRDLGVDVFLGNGRFTGRHSLEVNGKTLNFSKAVIATGARAVHPDVPGLAEAGYLTNETVFSLTERPAGLAVIGGGPIGCELAQAFQRLGSQVVLFHRNEHILDREDPDAAEIIQQRFIAEGIELVLNSRLVAVETGNGRQVIQYESDGQAASATVNAILVAAGRAPNVEHLSLEAAGVVYDARHGVEVDDHLRTSNPDIFAAGDICMKYKFTHAADAAARIVIQNALFKGSKKLSALTVPWCTYTEPEIAHVGMYAHEAAKQGVEVDTYTRHLNEVDRAILDGQTDGFVKIHTEKGKDRLIGATIVAAHAGDMISEISVAMAGKVGLGALGNVIHPYPTQAEAIKQTGDAFNRARLTPKIKWLFGKWLAWNR